MPMIRLHASIFSALFFFLFSTAAQTAVIPASILDAISGRLLDNSVIILGETHGRLESTELVAALAEAATREGQCLGIGLEVDSDQNDRLAAIMRKDASIENLFVWPVIDHEGYRTMLGRLRDLVVNGRCLAVRAMDLPSRLWRNDIGRDEWMAGRLAEMAEKGPVLALVGNLHALRSVTWENGKDQPYLAELLVHQGIEVQSLMQSWPEGECPERSVSWHAGNDQAAITAIRRTQDLISAVWQKDISAVTDGVLVWSCRTMAE